MQHYAAVCSTKPVGGVWRSLRYQIRTYNQSADEIDADDEEYQASNEKLAQLPVIFLVLPDGCEEHDDSQRTEHSSQKCVFGEIVAHHQPVEELNCDDNDQVEDEPIDQFYP